MSKNYDQLKDVGAYTPTKIDPFREYMGVRKLKRGYRRCLRDDCERRFYSEDLSNNRLCDSCRKRTKN